MCNSVVWTMWMVKSGVRLVYHVWDRFLFQVCLGFGVWGFRVLGWSEGTTCVFEDHQGRILCPYSAEGQVARALTEIEQGRWWWGGR